MKIICRAQPNLLTAHIAKHDGNFFFVICRAGGEKAAGKKFEVGRKFLAEAKLRFIKYIEPKKRRRKNP